MGEMNKPLVDIYTDGACSGNPGKGGYGVVLRFKKSNGEYVSKELSEGFETTTNNRMELLAAIVGLESLKKPCKITLTSDSWISKGWKTASKQPVKNVDLWKRLIDAMKPHEIDFVWVKGHAGHEFNEICDRLAVNAYNGDSLKQDIGFE